MTNPNNAIGTNGAFSGRTSPNALNDIAGAFTSGIVSGWTCSPKSGMTVKLGGSASTRDVALAEDNAGNKLTINNRSGAPVDVTLDGAPSTNNRVDAIVAYVDNPSTGDDNTTDNPTTCGIIAVKGTVAANPVVPTDAQIRAAITTDGATGGVAYYVVLATILVGTNVTTIGSGVITQGVAAGTAAIADGAVTAAKLAANAVETAKINNGAVTSQKVDFGTLVKTDVWTTTAALAVTGSSTNTSISVAEFGFSAATDYVVIATNMGGGQNGPFMNVTIDGKTANSFNLFAWNAHWSGGAVAAGQKIQWAVFRVKN